MEIAVLSGKGGAGKTMLAVGLAAVAGDFTRTACTYLDCDVEEPNGRLFLKPENVRTTKVEALVPVFDENKCRGCRKCVDFCRFNALVFIRNKPAVFPEICHSCGGCAAVCGYGAVTEAPRETGRVECGVASEASVAKNIHVVTGILNPGEPSGTGVIRKAKEKAFENGGLVITDCPPGSACTVVAGIGSADYCVLVVEPTAFGFHNFLMVYDLVKLTGKKFGVVVNKEEERYEPFESFCGENGVNILGRIKYDHKLAKHIALGKPACEYGGMRKIFGDIYGKIRGEIE